MNGDGIRCTLFVSGCSHQCRGCYQKRSWKPSEGFRFDEQLEQRIIDDLTDTKIVRSGLSLSGGDPLFEQNLDDILRLVKRVKSETSKSIFMWTGYLFEDLDEKRLEIINYVDVLVDGKFEKTLHDPMLRYRGSSNQRVIDVQKTLSNGEIILYHSGKLNYT